MSKEKFTSYEILIFFFLGVWNIGIEVNDETTPFVVEVTMTTSTVTVETVVVVVTVMVRIDRKRPETIFWSFIGNPSYIKTRVRHV